jgi:outer membrane protein assembly factor BamB
MIRAATCAAMVACFCACFISLAAAATGDWVTYAHDDRRTGFQPDPTGITTANVSSLQLHWSVALRELTTSSPIVAGDTVYVATRRGNVYALAADVGKIRWRRHIGNEVRMTPDLVDGQLLVAVYGSIMTRPATGASMQALDPKTGRVLWKTPFATGVMRSEPVVVGGVIYEGIAGGDPGSGCDSGRIVTLDEKTGKVLPGIWFTSPKRRNGGGIWSPLSYDGETIYFGTGNTCDGTGAQDSIVAITPALKTRWSQLAQAPGGDDEDVGGGVMIRGAMTYTEGKSGMLYALDRRTGKRRWASFLHADSPGGGGFATPAGDGTVLVANSGDGSSEPPNHTKLVAFDYSGHERYTIDEQSVATPSLGASFIPGIGFAGIDKSFEAFDARTGATLWSYETADSFYAVPAIATSGVFAVDISGNVYAFGLARPTAAALPETLASLPHDEPAPSKRRMAIFGGAVVIAIALGVGGIMSLTNRRRRS